MPIRHPSASTSFRYSTTCRTPARLGYRSFSSATWSPRPTAERERVCVRVCLPGPAWLDIGRTHIRVRCESSAISCVIAFEGSMCASSFIGCIAGIDMARRHLIHPSVFHRSLSLPSDRIYILSECHRAKNTREGDVNLGTTRIIPPAPAVILFVPPPSAHAKTRREAKSWRDISRGAPRGLSSLLFVGPHAPAYHGFWVLGSLGRVRPDQLASRSFILHPARFTPRAPQQGLHVFLALSGFWAAVVYTFIIRNEVDASSRNAAIAMAVDYLVLPSCKRVQRSWLAFRLRAASIASSPPPRYRVHGTRGGRTSPRVAAVVQHADHGRESPGYPGAPSARRWLAPPCLARRPLTPPCLAPLPAASPATCHPFEPEPEFCQCRLAGFEPKSHYARVSVVLGSNPACTVTGLASSAVRVSYLNQRTNNKPAANRRLPPACRVRTAADGATPQLPVGVLGVDGVFEIAYDAAAPSSCIQLEPCGPPAGGDARGVPFAVVSMAAPAYSVSANRKRHRRFDEPTPLRAGSRAIRERGDSLRTTYVRVVASGRGGHVVRVWRGLARGHARGVSAARAGIVRARTSATSPTANR
ncbi:hypothetical protein GGX14DRAFT_699209 [Mycena pura]|uniref:Uncharacterized protein n=1 Tax=Mycena pura TaxID=153505 RepID=A0AAD6V3Z4_9AGAR|nr:hypothetical protein GGX14DRAFT_699209 [Mycena pura]